MKNKKTFIFVCTLMLCLIYILPANAAQQEETSRIKASIEAFENSDGDIIGISSKGIWDEYPENSIPAVEAAAETDIDFVLIDVKRTSDGTLVVFSDDNTERMLSCDTVYTINQTDFSVLSEYYLNSSCGGKSNTVSQYKIPLLTEMLSVAKDSDIPLILRCSADIIPDIAVCLSQNDALDMCIVMTSSPAKELKAALSQCEKVPKIIGSKRGNVIFAMNSYVNTLSEIHALGVDLKTTNRYGINYYKSVVGNYSSKMRVIADPTTPEVCGARQDCEKWWNDLISRGYSVIITDYPEEFCDYKERNTEQRQTLSQLYEAHVTNKVLPDGFESMMLNDIKKAYTDAADTAKALLSDSCVSLQELTDACAALKKASNDVSINFSSLEDGSSGTAFTLARIMLCIAAAAVVVAVQIYFFKRRKKEE